MSTPSRRSFQDRGQDRGNESRVPIDSLNLSPDVTMYLKSFRQPLESPELTSQFGPRGDSVHEGIDLRAAVGTPVYAAQAGKVIYAGSKIASYGRLLVIKHEKGVSSVYAHNSRILVRKGEQVQQGQPVALSGNTGRSSGPHLHFEIRVGLKAVPPDSVIALSRGAQPRREIASKPLQLASSAKQGPARVSEDRIQTRSARALSRKPASRAHRQRDKGRKVQKVQKHSRELK